MGREERGEKKGGKRRIGEGMVEREIGEEREEEEEKRKGKKIDGKGIEDRRV